LDQDVEPFTFIVNSPPESYAKRVFEAHDENR